MLLIAILIAVAPAALGDGPPRRQAVTLPGVTYAAPPAQPQGVAPSQQQVQDAGEADQQAIDAATAGPMGFFNALQGQSPLAAPGTAPAMPAAAVAPAAPQPPVTYRFITPGAPPPLPGQRAPVVAAPMRVQTSTPAQPPGPVPAWAWAWMMRIQKNLDMASAINDALAIRKNPKLRQLPWFEVGWILFILLFAWWRKSRHERLLGKLWVSVYTTLILTLGTSFLVPWFVLGEPYRHLLVSIVKASV